MRIYKKVFCRRCWLHWAVTASASSNCPTWSKAHVTKCVCCEVAWMHELLPAAGTLVSAFPTMYLHSTHTHSSLSMWSRVLGKPPVPKNTMITSRLLIVHPSWLVTVSNSSFCTAGPWPWNSLPEYTHCHPLCLVIKNISLKMEIMSILTILPRNYSL